MFRFLYASDVHLLGTRVGCVAVEDADSAELTELRLSIAGGNEGEKFAIDSISGCITTVAGIDREEVEVYSLLIEVNKLQLGMLACSYILQSDSIISSKGKKLLNYC